MVSYSPAFKKFTEKPTISDVNLIINLYKTSNQHDYTDKTDWQLLVLDTRETLG